MLESSSSSKEMDNGMMVTEFILTGLSNCPAIRLSLFVAFLLVYLITLVANGLIFIAIGTEAKLHNPMYFSLSSLSLLDICCPTATMPKMLENLLSESNIISFTGCILQVNFLVAVAGREVFLLAVMAYDWYVAMCSPLQYMVIRNKRLHVLMNARNVGHQIPQLPPAHSVYLHPAFLPLQQNQPILL